MPRKKKIFTKTLYTYIQPVNRKFLETYTEKKKVSYSSFIDGLINQVRKSKTKAPKQKAA